MAGRLIRALGELMGRSYDGASNSRRMRGAGAMPVQLSAMHAARAPLGSRARYLAANTALGSSAARAWKSALVGTGIKPQSRHPDPAVRRQINAAFERWNDIADADGNLPFYGLQALAAERMIIDGEAFAAPSFVTDDDRFPLRIRLIDAEQCDAAYSMPGADGNLIVAGVEIDGLGKRQAYHMFRDRPGLPFGATLERVRVPAESIFHLFDPLVAGQLRGLSWFAPVLVRLSDLDAAHDAQLMRQKIAALMTGFITTGESAAGPFGGDPDAHGNLEATFEPGVLNTLNHGEDIRFSEPVKVGSEVIDFLKLTVNEIAAGLGLPASVLSGNVSDANYSSIRAALIDWRRRVEMIQYSVLIHQFCRPLWRQFITTSVLSGAIDGRGFERDPEAFFSVDWITPRFDWVDPLKDTEAEIAAIEAGLMSPRQAVAGRGYDLELLYQEIADDNRRAAELGLSFSRRSIPPQIGVAA
jgi:lambda family phage portal protein